ncbi:RHS repeat domain-containing protein [Spirosoma areae]
MKLTFCYALLVWLAVPFRVALAQKMPVDSVIIPSISQSVQDELIPQITPKSPTAAALSRYGEYPVSMYTGLPTIEIPIHEFKVGSLTVPIKLTYHASGNKVNDHASWVGLGWSLQTGGMITRNVQSRPDEQGAPTTGVLGQTITSPAYNPSCPTDASNLAVSDLADNLKDSQRDLFAYRTPAGSNSFILTPTATGFALLNSEPISLTTDTNLTSFTLTDATGTRFRFTDGEATNISSPPANGYSTYTSAWYLNEISSLNTSERAVYTYTAPFTQPSAPEPIDTWVVQANLTETEIGGSGVQTGITSQTNRDGALLISARLPTQIQFPGGKIEFALESRTDGGYGLDYIDVFSYDIVSSGFSLIKRFDFQYVSKVRSSGGGSEIFLDAIRLMQNDGTTVVGAYSFAYNEAVALPNAGSKAKDYWGYYNTNAGLTLIATQTLTVQERTNNPATTTFTIGDANRNPDESRMKAWILTGIQYPTGGSTQFDFEANRYTDNSTVRLAGGLRVRQIRSYTAPTQLATKKTYYYGLNQSGVGTFRSNIARTYTDLLTLNFFQPAGTGSPKSYSYQAYTYSSVPSYPLSPDEGSPVTYPEVAEYVEDASSNTTGKTVYEFRDAAVDSYIEVGGGRGFRTSRSWDRGQLVQKTITDTNGQLRAKTQNAYTSLGVGSTATPAGILIHRTVKQIGFKQSNGSCNTVDDVYQPFQTYAFSYGTTKLSSSSEYLYADDNSGNYTLKTTQTAYDAGFYMPREIRLLTEGPASSGNAIVGTQFSYPQDFGSIPAGAGSAELLGIRALQARNAYLPVEEVQFRQETTTAGKDYKTGKLTTYTPTTLNGRATALPYRTYRLESLYTSFPGSNPYQSSAQRYVASGNAGTFPVDPRMALRLTLNSYDANGNLTGYTLTHGSATAFAYNTYTPAGGVLFSVVSQQTLNAGQPNAQTSAFTYTRPLLGPQTTTDARGITTTYVYDGFGRLITLKDKDGFVLKQYSYHYATQP